MAESELDIVVGFRVACIICFCFGPAFVFLLVFVHAFSLAYHGTFHGSLIEGYLSDVSDEVSSFRVLLRLRPTAPVVLPPSVTIAQPVRWGIETRDEVSSMSRLTIRPRCLNH